MFQNPLDIREKSHVEHAIGLIENEILDHIESRVWMLEVIEKAARRGDENIHAASKCMLLGSHSNATDDRPPGYRRVSREGVELLNDLHGELARRR